MARERLTGERIRKFSTPAGRFQSFLWDTEAPGLAVRATAGSKAFIFQSKFKGKTIRLTIGDVRVWPIESDDPSQPGARQESRRLKTLIDQGIDPREHRAELAAVHEARRVEAKQKEALIADAWKKYVARHEKRWGSRHKADHINLANPGGQPKKRGKGLTVAGVLYPLLQHRMADISADVLIAWQTKEAATRPNNARQGFELFRAFWRWCGSTPEYSRIIDAQAVEAKDLRAEVPPRKSKRFDVLQRSHLKGWFSAVRGLENKVQAAYLQGLLLTGSRREELASMRWEHVDFRWKSLWLHDKVVEEGRMIPLTPYFAALLLDLKAINEAPPQPIKGKPTWQPSPWVFFSPSSASGRISEPRMAHNRALKVAGLDHVTLHGLRRTFASLAEWIEMPRGIVAQIMGHAPSATAERHYINRPLELLAIWHEKFEAWILEQAAVEFNSEGREKLRSIETKHRA